jgi:hypothetical protein
MASGAEPKRVELWTEGAPGSQDRKDEPEKTDRTNGACNVTTVHAPSITMFLPEAGKANGTAIIIAPWIHRVFHTLTADEPLLGKEE